MLRLYGAPLPLMGVKTRSALSGREDGLRPFVGEQIEKKIRHSRGIPAARMRRRGCLTIGSVKMERALDPPHPEEREARLEGCRRPHAGLHGSRRIASRCSSPWGL